MFLLCLPIGSNSSQYNWSQALIEGIEGFWVQRVKLPLVVVKVNHLLPVS